MSITRLAAGEGAYNVIPDSANFGGTLRSLSHDHLMYLKQRMEEVSPVLQPLMHCAVDEAVSDLHSLGMLNGNSSPGTLSFFHAVPKCAMHIN